MGIEMIMNEDNTRVIRLDALDDAARAEREAKPECFDGILRDLNDALSNGMTLLELNAAFPRIASKWLD